jgi:ribose transport system ATP-binding protein
MPESQPSAVAIMSDAISRPNTGHSDTGQPDTGQPDTGRPEGGLHIRHLSKQFPGVRALDDVELRVGGGTVHALLGHNGCGKSTLVKILAGFHSPAPGFEATVDGEPFKLGSPEEAERCGLRFVHQELGLVNQLGAADNIGLALGYRRGRFGPISWRRQSRLTEELLSGFGIHLDPDLPLAEATPVERSAVAIVRALAGSSLGRGLLVLDEPTAALPAREVDQLFRLIRQVADSGTPVLMISHRIDEVMTVADQATVMRSGRVIWSGPTATMSVRGFAALIAGDDVATSVPVGEEVATPRPMVGLAISRRRVLSVRDLTARYLRGIDMDVHAGEVVGIAGLLGSGREELPYIVAGALAAGVSGTICVEDSLMAEPDILEAQTRGVAFVPADRASEGIIADFNVRENVSLVALPRLRQLRTLRRARERSFAHEWLAALGADPAVMERPVGTLSGGNQQKTVLARLLSVGPKLLVLCEPTAGIDIGARRGIYRELRSRAERGLSVLMSSSDTDDLVAACDRVLVLRGGHLVAELTGADITKSAIVAAMEGVHGDIGNGKV